MAQIKPAMENIRLDRWTRVAVEAECDGLLENAFDDAYKAAQDLLTAIAGCQAAQQQLRSQAGNVELVATAALGGTAALAHPQLQDALDQVQATAASLDHTQAVVGEAGRRVVEALAASAKWHTACKQLPTMVLAATNGWHNANSSPALALPDAALQSIAHHAGKHVRLVCQQLRDAYGAHKASIRLQHELAPTLRPPPYMALSSFLPARRWHAQLTRLECCIEQPTALALLADIACQMPRLQRLTCPWPEPHQPEAAGATGSPLTALTHLELNRPFPDNSPPTRPVQSALSIVPHLAPQLASLQLELHSMLHVDAASAMALQAVSSLTHLSLDNPWIRDAPYDRGLVLNLFTACRSSLHSLRLQNMSLYGQADLLSVAAAMMQLVDLELSGSEFQVIFGDAWPLYPTPACRQLPQVRRLQLPPSSREEAVPHMADWLQAGPAGSCMRDLVLPLLHARPQEPAQVDAVRSVVAAAASHTGLTSLTVGVTGWHAHNNAPPLGWSIAIGSLAGLRKLTIMAMSAVELSVAAEAWRPLTALTRLDLTAQYLLSASATGLVAGVRQTFAHLSSLRRVTLGFHDSVWSDSDFPAFVTSRRWFLGAVAALPRLQVLNLAGAADEGRGPGLVVEDLAVLAEGQAAGALRRLVLERTPETEAAAEEVGRLLPGVKVEWIG